MHAEITQYVKQRNMSGSRDRIGSWIKIGSGIGRREGIKQMYHTFTQSHIKQRYKALTQSHIKKRFNTFTQSQTN